METKIYNQLPDEAKEIRLEVFVKEQGFEEEFDDIDETAAHIVLFDGSHPVGVCRIFTDPGSGRVMIGSRSQKGFSRQRARRGHNKSRRKVRRRKRDQ